MQIRRDELMPAKFQTNTKLVFETLSKLAMSPKGTPKFSDPALQGRSDERFLYVNSGKRAGQPTSCWDRRAKVMLTSIHWELLRTIPDGGVLESEIDGLAGDGGPCCATVPLIGGSWRQG